MQRRPLGNTGIDLPALGFGCADNSFLMTGDDTNLQIETIKLALESGIDHFDTASKYGNGLSETNLGRALQALGASPTISTKVILQHEDLGDPKGAVLRSFEMSLQRLGVDRVAAFMLHNRVFHNPEPGAMMADGAQVSMAQMFASNGILAAFQELKQANLVGTFGFTALGGEPSAIAEMIDSSAFGAINGSFSIMNPSSILQAPAAFEIPDYEGAIKRAATAGMGTMAIQVLARGNLTGNALESTPTTSALFNVPKEGRQRLVATTTGAIAKKLGDTVVGVAIRYVLSKPEISIAIVGISEPRHAQEAAAAVARGPLDDESIAVLEQASVG